MTVWKDYNKSGGPGYSLTEHGFGAWLLDNPHMKGKITYHEWLRKQTERNRVLENIWRTVVKLETEDMWKVYYFIRGLLH